jgi:hypothetical protein
MLHACMMQESPHYFDCYSTTDIGFLMGKLLTFFQTTFAEPEAAS